MKAFVAVILFLPFLTQANCNVDLAVASGKYLVALEKAKMQSYQGGGACTVLDGEYKKCSKKDQTKLSKVLDIRQVLGNICMPYLPPPEK